MSPYPVREIRRADQNAGIDTPREPEHPDAPAIPSAGLFFDRLDGLRGGFFGCPDYRYRPHVAQERVERIKAAFQETFDVVHRVKQADIRFDHPPPDHFDRARLAHARFVVAIHVGAHREFGFFLGRVQQLADADFVADWIAGSPCRTRDGTGFDTLPFHAHKHLWRCAYKLLFAKL